MRDGSPVSDERLARALGVYCGMVDRVVRDPSRWLGLDEDPPPTAGFPARVLDALRDRALGDVTPASPRWSALPVGRRVRWWVTRIGVSARLAVCATAREHGRTDAAWWVPLLGRVLFHRDLSADRAGVPDSAESEQRLAAETDGDDRGLAERLGRGALRAAGTVWRLARTLWDLQSLFDERPRGSVLARTLAKVPVVGLAGGWLTPSGGTPQSTTGVMAPRCSRRAASAREPDSEG